MSAKARVVETTSTRIALTPPKRARIVGASGATGPFDGKLGSWNPVPVSSTKIRPPVFAVAGETAVSVTATLETYHYFLWDAVFPRAGGFNAEPVLESGSGFFGAGESLPVSLPASKNESRS